MEYISFFSLSYYHVNHTVFLGKEILTNYKLRISDLTLSKIRVTL